MLRFIMLIITLLPMAAFATDSLRVQKMSLTYHYLPAKKQSDKLLIYLHGSVSQYKDLKAPRSVSLDELTEGNSSFVSTVQEKGYDVVMPIAFNEFNWLDSNGYVYIDALLDELTSNYSKVIISGFSDGGTGAYRMFYDHPERFDGLIVYNGYPQHEYFSEKVDYSSVTSKPVIFSSTKEDKTIPYEFLLVEYRRQRMVNTNCHFSLLDGGHDFSAYSKHDILKDLVLLEQPLGKAPHSDSLTVYAAFDGIISNDRLLEVFPFRKSVGKQFGMTEIAYQREDFDYKYYDKELKKGTIIKIHPITVHRNELRSNDHFGMTVELKGESYTIDMINWLKVDMWN